jgi:type VI secretion system secreted protein Hcp
MRTWITRTITGALLASSLAVALPALAAMDMFIKLGDIKGESLDSKHKDEIDILSWSWGVSNSTSVRAAGAATGKATVNSLVLTKYIDASSPLLFQSAVKGTVLKEATFVVRKSGGKTIEFIKIKLTDVFIASVKPGGSSNQDRMTEEITLVFGGAEYSYTPQRPDGSAGGAVTVAWKASG